MVVRIMTCLVRRRKWQVDDCMTSEASVIVCGLCYSMFVLLCVCYCARVL